MQRIQKAISFLRGETVLCAAVLLALLSFLLTPPGPEALSAVDWDTLALLFSLMAVMKGFQRAGVFLALGGGLLRRAATTRRMVAALVFLPFFLSMAVTNDVALLTFVPFALVVLRMAGQERLAVPVVVLQTIAANLGSMLTPMGNPQNLYLYAQSGMPFGALVLLMLPYAALSAAGLAALCAARSSAPVAVDALPPAHVEKHALPALAAGFALCLLALFGALPPLLVAAVLAAYFLLRDRAVLRAVDYALLLTFFAFFVFIGNLRAVEGFRSLLSTALEGRAVPVSILASQVISNVPAALLLSGFTSDWPGLLVGCNLGGLGTLIASMASLISYKFIAREFPREKGRYFLRFTVWNAVFLAALLAECSLLGAL